MKRAILHTLLVTCVIGHLSGQSFSRSHTLSVTPTEAPYLVSLSVPNGSDIHNVSDAGRYDEASSTILWGPFTETTAISLAFDLISESSATISSAAQITYTTTSGTSSSPVAASPTQTYLSWVKTAEGLGFSRAALSASIDLDGDGTPNAIEYLLDLSLTESNAIWDGITLQPSGNGYEITFPNSINASEFRLLVDVLDLANGGVIESIEPALNSPPYTISSQSERFIFRLRADLD